MSNLYIIKVLHIATKYKLVISGHDFTSYKAHDYTGIFPVTVHLKIHPLIVIRSSHCVPIGTYNPVTGALIRGKTSHTVLIRIDSRYLAVRVVRGYVYEGRRKKDIFDHND